jgi:hypothetical protein
MVESKVKTTRAKVAHKLAKYVRATPVHLTGVTGNANPSTSHLSKTHINQHSEEHPREESEIAPRPGTPLTMRPSTSRETATSPKHLKVENQSLPAQSSSSSPESAEAEELSSLKHSPQAIS